MWKLLWTMACNTSWLWSAHCLIRFRLGNILGSRFWWRFGRLRNWRSARLTCSWTWILTRRDKDKSEELEAFRATCSQRDKTRYSLSDGCGSNPFPYIFCVLFMLIIININIIVFNDSVSHLLWLWAMALIWRSGAKEQKKYCLRIPGKYKLT